MSVKIRGATIVASVLCAILAGVWSPSGNVLKGLDSGRLYSLAELQMVSLGFCLSSLPSKLMAEHMAASDNLTLTFEDTGNIENDAYTVGSIYAFLYSLYSATELTSPHGIRYFFTFNTWGVAPSAYPQEDPERFGKAAYAALLTQPPVLEYQKALGESRKLKIVEIGCGTGAGANLITREVHPTSEYLALDMQHAAVDTCKLRHATEDNPGLQCKWIQGGVGKGRPVPIKDETVDLVVISETHIADEEIGEIEKEIFAEVLRVLRPGGLFLWGNALPTRVWRAAKLYLPTLGLQLVHEYNHTMGAVEARDLDAPRVDAAINGLLGPLYALQLPYVGRQCGQVAERLIANFYRHPGTALYYKMTIGYDSYMHQAWMKPR